MAAIEALTPDAIIAAIDAAITEIDVVIGEHAERLFGSGRGYCPKCADTAMQHPCLTYASALRARGFLSALLPDAAP